MVIYKVTVSDEAKASLREIYNYLKEKESITTARNVRDGILETIEQLAQMPHRHGLANEINNDQIIYRRALKWSYKIVFTIDEDEIVVRVVDIIHAKQNPQRLQDKFGN